MKAYGLIGFPLTHSFSENYFTQKFAAEGITDRVYSLYELPDIGQFPQLLQDRPDLVGINVTIPYKEAVIPFLNELEPEAARIGAINVIKIENGRTTGYNSDYQGFKQSLEKFLDPHFSSRALVLGTGGASKAVKAALSHLHIPFVVVSRQPDTAAGEISYQELDAEMLSRHQLIINTTPLGTYPKTDTCPDIPYTALTEQHYLYDLVYNPAETLFLKKGKAAGAQIKNGYEMLVLQAEVAWQIWNS
jgi:shikimate dehydrogenase